MAKQKKKDTEQKSSAASFEALGLDPLILDILGDEKWSEPTPIQKEAIPTALKGTDLIGVAQTGTGKTGAFVLPIVQTLYESTGEVRALILLPTRELALQVEEQVKKFAPAFGLTHAVIYGGAPIGPQRMALREGVDIIVATPGRLLDMMNHVLIQWGKLKFLVLDEADRMLDMGFIPDVEKILRKLPMARQTMLFTATMAPQIQSLSRHYMLYPKEITIGYNRTVASGITQWVYDVTEREKTDLLLQMLDKLSIDSGLIFCRTKKGTDELGTLLKKRGFNVGTLHSDRTQSMREETLNKFRSNELTYLVATDVASRGLDITGVTHVINFDVPQNPDDYIHRVGRTARASAKGDAITFVSPRDQKAIQRIEELLDYKLERSVLADFGKKKVEKAAEPEKAEEPKRPERRPRPKRERKVETPTVESPTKDAIVRPAIEASFMLTLEEFERLKLVREQQYDLVRAQERARNKW